MLQEEIERFKKFDLNQVVHTNQENNFINKRQPLDEIYEMLHEIIDIIQIHPLHDGLAIPLEEYLLHFNNLLNQLLIYDYKTDDTERRTYRNLLVSIDNMYKQFFGQIDEKNPTYPLLKNFDLVSTYNFVKLKTLSSIDDTRSAAQKKLEAIEEIGQKVTDLHKEMQRQSTETVSEKYANIFGQEALIHSNSYFNKGKTGAAQYWLITAVFTIIAFITFLAFIDCLMPIKVNTTPTVTVLEYLRRLFTISFIIYLITFMIKQYNIRKHLSAVNRHRENTLNSFKLFIQSIDSTDTDVKNTIVKEIAKAIYESGETGFISNKAESPETNSIITEINKYIKP
jgi:hypothetical protein